ncbi:MAG: ABC transporter substrate-binding protein [Pseudomonadota bacterium]
MSRVDRRALFTSGAAAALLAATGVSLDAAPRSGGRLRIAVARDGSFDAVMRRAAFDTLTEVGPDGVLRSELATSWSGSADARHWMFEIRTGVSFHDGEELIAQDIRRSLRDAGLPGAIRVDHDHMVAIDLQDGNPDLPLMLSDTRWSVTRGATIGTGLYRVAQVRDDRHFLGQRSGQHYKDGRAGWPDSVEVITIPDAKVRAEALRDGYVDVAAMPDAPDFADAAGFRVQGTRSAIAMAAHIGVGMPKRVSDQSALDDGRIAERWWLI